MQGIGGGGVIVMNLIIMTDVIPLRFRPKYNGVSQVAWALGTIIGPIIGGVIAEKTTWRWLFYLNFPFCGIGLLMVPFVVRISRARKSVRAGLLQFDWFGSCLFIASTTILLIGLHGEGTSTRGVAIRHSYHCVLVQEACFSLVSGKYRSPSSRSFAGPCCATNRS